MSKDFRSASSGPTQISRRTLLVGGFGAATLIALPTALDRYAPAAVAGAANASAPAGAVPPASSAAGHVFYILGNQQDATGESQTLSASNPIPSSASVSSGSSAAATTLTTNLAGVPTRSPDGSLIAVPYFDATGKVLTLDLYNSGSAQISKSFALHLNSALPGSLTLVSTVFNQTTTVISLLITVMQPYDPKQVAKYNPNTGENDLIDVAHWVNHHEVAYINLATGVASGPFSLSDAPTMPYVNAIADSENLYLWSLWAAIDEIPPNAKSLSPGEIAALASLQFTVLPLGSATPALQEKTPGLWPAGVEFMTQLPNGGLARVMHGRRAEVFQPTGGPPAVVDFDIPLGTAAKPGSFTYQKLNPTTLLVGDPSNGQATKVDLSNKFATTTCNIQPSSIPAGGLNQKIVASPDGSVVYAPGERGVGGISGYGFPSGNMVSSFADQRDYVGLYSSPDGSELLAICRQSPNHTLLNSSLSVIEQWDEPYVAIGVV